VLLEFIYDRITYENKFRYSKLYEAKKLVKLLSWSYSCGFCILYSIVIVFTKYMYYSLIFFRSNL